MFPLVPFGVPWLWPLHDYAPIIWFSGLVCLWLTRYAHRLARGWGSRYYVLSASTRPLGVLLIAIGWLVVAAEPTGVTPRTLRKWLPVLGWRHGPTVLFWIEAYTRGVPRLFAS
jgi:hypothetical protein